MTNDLPPDEKAYVEELRKRIRSQDRKFVAAKDVKRFRQAITAELQSEKELTKETVDRLLDQFRAGKL